MTKRILIVIGHSAKHSLCQALACAYEQGALTAGHEVKTLALGQLAFDPILREGYNAIQDLEPDLLGAQQDIVWAQHLVFVYPVWWGAIPALMKGFFDRAFLPGFAFQFKKGTLMVDGLLKGRSAELLATMDTPPWYYRWVYRMPGHHQMKRTILEFCGIGPVRVHGFGPVKTATEQKRAKWVQHAYRLGLGETGLKARAKRLFNPNYPQSGRKADLL